MPNGSAVRRSSAWYVSETVQEAASPELRTLDATVVRDRMLELGVITRAIGNDTLSFCPPLVIRDDEIDRIVDALATAVA